MRVPDWLAGKTIAELGAIELGHTLLFPGDIVCLDAKGNEDRTPVLLKAPTKGDRYRARLDAIDYVRDSRKDKSITTVDAARAAVGAELFEDLDTVAIVARCTLDRETRAQFMLLGVLWDSYPIPSLYDVYDKLDWLSQLVDPRIGELTEEDFWRAVGAVAKVQNTSPLVAMRGATQRDFVVRLASMLWSSRTSSSSSLSGGTSTPGS